MKHLLIPITALVVVGCSTTEAPSTVQDHDTTDVVVETDAQVATRLLLEQQTKERRTHIVLFDFDSSQLRPEYLSILRAHAAYLKQHPDTSLVVEGHTDDEGTEYYNLGLGERRAQRVGRYLIDNGVKPSQLVVIGRAYHYPRAHEDTPAARQSNRRVALIY
ncbi:OmpA family protein [Neiella sp. HB171785]|uniref:OmpA family protein n=1 Tax=Neiella litorisoli TaxID=2771431 RepID=A0A8J6QU63_9GAMM|nr:OmpA family protein [Neiella litorisoli]MBD1389482.1 OmpA family protein [Neiella litorisoli]